MADSSADSVIGSAGTSLSFPKLEGENGSPSSPEAHPLPGAHLARFLELRGRRALEVNGTWWGHHKGPFLTSLPFHRCLAPRREELDRILRKESILGLRFPSRELPGLASGVYTARPAGYGLRSVHRKQRSQVLRGLEMLELRNMDPDELLSKGLPLNQETLARQNRADASFLDPVGWKSFVRAVSLGPGLSIHGAFLDGKLVTYVISCREGTWLHLLHKMSLSAFREHRPDHALDFSIIGAAARDGHIEGIVNGCVPVMPNAGLDRYKRQLGYQVEAQNLCLHLHPALAFLLTNRASVSAARRARAALPDAERVAYGARILEGARTTRSGWMQTKA